jgi:hypothetical protein
MKLKLNTAELTMVKQEVEQKVLVIENLEELNHEDRVRLFIYLEKLPINWCIPKVKRTFLGNKYIEI